MTHISPSEFAIGVPVAKVATRAMTWWAGTPPARASSWRRTWMVERACYQNLPNEAPPFDDELKVSLAQIIWAALYFEEV
jgi:hypothetical protein